MYKILLVTDRPEILDAFQAVSSWESLGFRVPRICNSAEGAIACLKAHHGAGGTADGAFNGVLSYFADFCRQ